MYSESSPILKFHTKKVDEEKDNLKEFTVDDIKDLGRKRKAVHDVSIQILDEFRKRPRLTLPDAKYLKDHIDRELDIKIPLLQYEFEVRRKVLFSSYGFAIFKDSL
ncbi:unnamed protein product [Rhizophagus irregularis]|nr:unnamed protein product [Rhizophagus irregularis]CAB4416987.1 unnamed protein product [Rhizophagus irregularis]